jgi:hypothetical protein
MDMNQAAVLHGKVARIQDLFKHSYIGASWQHGDTIDVVDRGPLYQVIV